MFLLVNVPGYFSTPFFLYLFFSLLYFFLGVEGRVSLF